MPGEYAPPGGRLLLALAEARAGRLRGAAALRRRRRRDEAPVRAAGVPGAAAWEGAWRRRRSTPRARPGSHALLLDTLPKMTSAIALYRALGFRAARPLRLAPDARRDLFRAAALAPRRSAAAARWSSARARTGSNARAPPRASTSRAPTMRSTGQSPPFTSTSGRQASDQRARRVLVEPGDQRPPPAARRPPPAVLERVDRAPSAPCRGAAPRRRC